MGRSSGAPKRGPGRPRKVTAPSGLDGIAGSVDAVRTAERDRAHLRGVLEKLQAVVADALA